MRRGLIAVAALLVLAGAAHARPAGDERVIPGVGIGKLRLGMTEAQVRKALGAPLARRVKRVGFGRTEIELQYGFSAYLVTLTRSRAATRRVTAIATGLVSERTLQGHGVNTREAALVEAFGSMLACERLKTTTYNDRVYVAVMEMPYRECALRSGDAETVFRTAIDEPWMSLAEEWRPLARVVEVVVRVR